MSKIKKTVIFAGYQCNNHCLFCINAGKREINAKTTNEIIAQMKYARQRGRTYLELIGGELTMRSDIFTLLSWAKQLGFETIAMATNGRMLSYQSFARKLIASGLNHIIFSIHGDTAQLHDELTQAPGSFDQLMQGIAHLRQLDNVHIASNTTIVRQNYKKMPAIGKMIYSLNIRNAEFIFVDPSYGGAHDNFSQLVPKLSQAAPYIRQCLMIGRNHDVRHWAIRYVPICLFADYQQQISELKEVSLFETEHLAPDFQNYQVEQARKSIARIKPQRCKSCKYYQVCEGLWKEYIRYYGDDELQPLG